MGFQGLGLNSRYTSVVQVNNNTEGTFQQESARTYDVGLNTSGFADPDPLVIYDEWGLVDIADGSSQTRSIGSSFDNATITETRATLTINDSDFEDYYVSIEDGSGTYFVQDHHIFDEGSVSTGWLSYTGKTFEFWAESASTDDISTATLKIELSADIGTTSDYTVTGVTQE